MFMETSASTIEVPPMVAELLASLRGQIAHEESVFMERKARLEATIADRDILRQEIDASYDRMEASMKPVRAQIEAITANLADLYSVRPLTIKVPLDSVSL